MSAYTRLAETLAEFDALHPALAPDNDPRTDKVIDAARAFVAEAQAPLYWIPGGWLIRRHSANPDAICVAAPDCNPGGMVLFFKGTLERRLLYRLAEALIAAPPQPQAEPVAMVCSAPKDGRECYPSCDCETEADCEYGAKAAAPQPQASPQASAEDVELVDDSIDAMFHDESSVAAAWQRIRASLRVGRE